MFWGKIFLSHLILDKHLKLCLAKVFSNLVVFNNCAQGTLRVKKQ